jgi:hypothetical protein
LSAAIGFRLRVMILIELWRRWLKSLKWSRRGFKNREINLKLLSHQRRHSLPVPTAECGRSLDKSNDTVFG